MQEIKFTSLTNCQQQRKVLHYGTLFQVKDCSHAPLCTYVPLQCLSANHMLTVCGLFSQKVAWLATYVYLTIWVLLIPYIDLTHIIHMQQGKVRFVVLLTDFLLVLNLLEPRDHSRKAVKKQPFEDHMFSDNKYATNKVHLVIWSCL